MMPGPGRCVEGSPSTRPGSFFPFVFSNPPSLIMSESKEISELGPSVFNREDQFSYEAMLARNSYEEIEASTPVDRKNFIIREEYARRMAELKAAGRTNISNPSFIGWAYKWTRNAEQAWFCQKSDGISMFPLFPFLHYFLDFADPFKKIAVLVEEAENPWLDSEALQEQDSLLTLAGWTVYRIPSQVANTYETSLLPENLQRCPYGEFDDNEQLEEYRDWQARLNMSRTTIDGFFDWLKQEVYTKTR